MQVESDRGRSGTRSRRTLRSLWIVCVGLLLLLLLKTFVADVYRINSGSMRPTLFGGATHPGGESFTEWVLVGYDRAPELARFDLVVLDARDGGEAVVKRVVGLPEEKVRIWGGDLFVNGERLGIDVPRPAPIPIFDDRYQDPEAFFYYARESGVWHREGGTWILEGKSIPPGRSEGTMFLNLPLRDEYLDPAGERVEGLVEVNDAVLECEFSLEELDPAGALRFRLVEEGDTFELRLVARSGGERVELVRRNQTTLQASEAGEREQHVASSDVNLEPDRFQRLRFSNVDNHLVVELADLCTLRAGYDENEPCPVASAPGQSVGPRVSFGGEGVQARFRALRILRDLYYSSSGTFGVEAPADLGPDEIFVLGDNSTSSQDSRHFGSVPLSEVVGRPRFVLWPPWRLRPL